MQKKAIVILTFLTVFLFLGIRTGYNFAPTFSLFTFIKDDVINFKNFDWELASYTKNCAFVGYEMLLGLLFLLISSFFKNKFWLLISSLLLLSIWWKNYIFYRGIMDEHLYLLSSIYFLISMIFFNFYNLFFKTRKSV